MPEKKLCVLERKTPADILSRLQEQVACPYLSVTFTRKIVKILCLDSEL